MVVAPMTIVDRPVEFVQHKNVETALYTLQMPEPSASSRKSTRSMKWPMRLNDSSAA